VAASASRPDPETSLMWGATQPQPPAFGGGVAADDVDSGTEAGMQAPQVELRVAFQPFQTHDPASPASTAQAADDAGAGWEPVDLSQGEPS
jgi:hypothetical protein